MLIKVKRTGQIIEGELLFIFPANRKPNFDDVVEYYCDGNVEEAKYHRYLPQFMRTSRVDRYVLKKPNGFNIIVPNNPQVFTIIDSSIGNSHEE